MDRKVGFRGGVISAEFPVMDEDLNQVFVYPVQISLPNLEPLTVERAVENLMAIKRALENHTITRPDQAASVDDEGRVFLL